MMFKTLIISVLSLAFTVGDTAQDQEIIYGRRDGMALVMTVLKPEKPNGKAIVSIISSGWHCDHAWFATYKNRAMPFVEAGYTVFLAEHASAPRYAIPDALLDIQTAVQYVRFHSKDFGIDPNLIGITGTSSGGHLALLVAAADDIKQMQAKDPIARISSKVQAAAVFCGPTDFLNYGKPKNALRDQKALLQQLGVVDCFRYTNYDEKQNSYVVMDDASARKTDSLMSPVHVLTADDAPVYISHGDKDDIVPLQQSQTYVAKSQKLRIPAQLAVKPDAGHGWKNMNEDEKGFVAWFDRYLN